MSSEGRRWKAPICKMTGELRETDLDHDGNVVCDECAGELEWIEVAPASEVEQAWKARDVECEEYKVAVERLRDQLDQAYITTGKIVDKLGGWDQVIALLFPDEKVQ